MLIKAAFSLAEISCASSSDLPIQRCFFMTCGRNHQQLASKREDPDIARLEVLTTRFHVSQRRTETIDPTLPAHGDEYVVGVGECPGEQPDSKAEAQLKSQSAEPGPSTKAKRRSKGNFEEKWMSPRRDRQRSRASWCREGYVAKNRGAADEKPRHWWTPMPTNGFC